MSWTNPLRNLAPTIPHPAPNSIVSSELSSVLEDSDDWYQSRTRVLKVLEERFTARDAEDDTAKVLGTFVMKLPKMGQLILMSEILRFQDDAPTLRYLRNFLVDAILKPSMRRLLLPVLHLTNIFSSAGSWWQKPQDPYH